MNTEFPLQRTDRYKRLWLQAIPLTLLAGFAIEIVMTAVQNLRTDAFPGQPWTLCLVWLVGTLVVLGRIAARFRITQWYFFGACFGGIIVLGVLTAIMPRAWSDWTPLPYHYLGIDSRVTTDMHPTDNGAAVYDHPLQAGTLFPSSCPQLGAGARSLMRYNQYAGARGFYTWQAGLAAGYEPDPDCVPEYDGGVTFSERLSLYLTVGPLVLIEALARSLTHTFLPLLLLQPLYFKLTREFFWWARRDWQAYVDAGSFP